MNKELRNFMVFVGIFLMAIFIVWFMFSDNSYEPTITGEVINENDNQGNFEQAQKETSLIFYDNKTQCKLNGDVYVDDVLLGKSKNGIFVLKEDDYKQKFRENSTLHIYGLTDYCFESNSNLPFVEYWIVPDLQYYFYYNENASFEASINPRSPRYYLEMQGFIRPSETEDYLNSELRKYFKNNTEEDLDIIAKYMTISYISDWNLFKKSEYWQTPAETLKRKMGDCEDWAVTTLSLMRAYNDSIRCFNALWQTHMSVFCYFNNNFIIYDQDRVKFKTRLNTENTQDYIVKQENQIAIRKMRNNYLDEYGISPGETKLSAVLNEKELVIFEEDEDFVNWALNLIKE